LLPGFDFTRNQAGASEMVDLSSNVAASLAQSTDSILDGNQVFQLNSSTAAILSQSTDSILDGHVPHEFGHGTMTAGLVHLIAPAARILPLKAFRGDGTSDLNGIVRAIYYAADHGANIISMSFEISQSSGRLHQCNVCRPRRRSDYHVSGQSLRCWMGNFFQCSYGGGRRLIAVAAKSRN